MSDFKSTACFVPEYSTGPCNDSVIRDLNGSILYNATVPYTGPVSYNRTVYWLNGTRLDYTSISALEQNGTNLNITYEADCLWVLPFQADPDIVSRIILF